MQARFLDAGLVVPGDDVSSDGARIGTVSAVALTDEGTALVTMTVDRGVPMHSDATASVQQADLLGDVYVELDPGTAARPLSGPISTSRTYDGTTVQDVFDAFNAPTRSALQSLIVELGTALNGHGEDLNQAVLQLAPGIAEADRVASQLGSQNADLTALIDNAEGLTSQLAARHSAIARLIDGLDHTLAITATRAGALSAGLHKLPSTLVETRSTLTDLRSLTNHATPLATQVGNLVPALSAAVDEITPFVSHAKPAFTQLGPLLALAGHTLKSIVRPINLLATPVRQLSTLTPSLDTLANIVYPVIQIGLKGIYGGLGGLGAETSADGRNEFRAELVLGCEIFGVPTGPGCLTRVLDASDQTSSKPSGVSFQPSSPTPSASRTTPVRQDTTPTATTPESGAPPLGQLSQTLSGTVNGLLGAVKGIGGGKGSSGGRGAGTTTDTTAAPGSGTKPGNLSQLLNYLLKP